MEKGRKRDKTGLSMCPHLCGLCIPVIRSFFSKSHQNTLGQRAGELQSHAAPPVSPCMRDPVDLRSLGEIIYWESRCSEASHEASTLLSANLCCCTWILTGYVYTIISTDYGLFFGAMTRGHHTYAEKCSFACSRHGHAPVHLNCVRALLGQGKLSQAKSMPGKITIN